MRISAITLAIFGPLGFILAISPVTPAIQHFGVVGCVLFALAMSFVSAWLIARSE